MNKPYPLDTTNDMPRQLTGSKGAESFQPINQRAEQHPELARELSRLQMAEDSAVQKAGAVNLRQYGGVFRRLSESKTLPSVVEEYLKEGN